MKIWFDTEFYEDGDTIELISIGAVREDGKTFYAEVIDAADLCLQSDWLKENVLPHLRGPKKPRRHISQEFFEFVGEKPEFWAYYCSYDWVALCQLYGRMIQLPKGWPMYCRDVKQFCDDVGNPKLPPQDSAKHDALNDALWTRDAWKFLEIEKYKAEVRSNMPLAR